MNTSQQLDLMDPRAVLLVTPSVPLTHPSGSNAALVRPSLEGLNPLGFEGSRAVNGASGVTILPDLASVHVFVIWHQILYRPPNR